MKSQVPRWTTSIPMAQKAYNQYVGGMTDGCIMLAHSQGGLFTVNAVLEHPVCSGCCYVAFTQSLSRWQQGGSQ